MPGNDAILVKVFIIIHLLSGLATSAFDCKQCENPNYKDPNYKPQDCAKYCSSISRISSRGDNIDSIEDEVEYLVEKVESISMIINALLILVILITLLILYFIVRNTSLSKSILKSWKQCWRSKRDNQDTKRDLNHVTVHKGPNVEASSIKAEKPKVLFTNEKLSRKPSESLSPDDSDAVVVDGYDNLGMSRSTINTHSRCSSPSSPTSNNGATSCATINTTMTTINLDS